MTLPGGQSSLPGPQDKEQSVELYVLNVHVPMYCGCPSLPDLSGGTLAYRDSNPPYSSTNPPPPPTYECQDGKLCWHHWNRDPARWGNPGNVWLSEADLVARCAAEPDCVAYDMRGCTATPGCSNGRLCSSCAVGLEAMCSTQIINNNDYKLCTRTDWPSTYYKTHQAVGSVATHSCDTGELQGGDENRTCLANFSWGGAARYCGCPALPAPADTSVTYPYEYLVDESTQCGWDNGGLAGCGWDNMPQIGSGGERYDDSLSTCKAQCDASSECGGFSWKESTGRCYYRYDTTCARAADADRTCYTKDGPRNRQGVGSVAALACDAGALQGNRVNRTCETAGTWSGTWNGTWTLLLRGTAGNVRPAAEWVSYNSHLNGSATEDFSILGTLEDYRQLDGFTLKIVRPQALGWFMASCLMILALLQVWPLMSPQNETGVNQNTWRQTNNPVTDTVSNGGVTVRASESTLLCRGDTADTSDCVCRRATRASTSILTPNPTQLRRPGVGWSTTAICRCSTAAPARTGIMPWAAGTLGMESRGHAPRDGHAAWSKPLSCMCSLRQCVGAPSCLHPLHRLLPRPAGSCPKPPARVPACARQQGWRAPATTFVRPQCLSKTRSRSSGVSSPAPALRTPEASRALRAEACPARLMRGSLCCWRAAPAWSAAPTATATTPPSTASLRALSRAIAESVTAMLRRGCRSRSHASRRTRPPARSGHRVQTSARAW